MKHFFFALSLLCMSPAVRAQVAGGMIQGTVKDSTGASIADAQVFITNTNTGVVRETSTNPSGSYSAANLVPGRYEITASASGFANRVASDVLLTVGEQKIVDLSLTVKSQSQEVTVSEAVPAVDTVGATLSGVVNSETIVDLPLNGRDWASLATLEPGVSGILTQPSNSTTSATRLNRGVGSQLTIGGNRPQQNNYRVDGISTNDYANAAPGGVLGADLGVDAIQEFSVITSNAPAAYGKSSGGIINAVTRGGTNSFHGSVYEFLRNSALDARNFFDGPRVPPFKRNQFGASAGGPIVRNKTFIFGDYEGMRQSLGNTQTIFVPSRAARNGPVNPNVRPYLALYPLPNGPETGSVGQSSFVNNQLTTEDFFTARADHTFSANDFMHGTYLLDTGESKGPNNTDTLITGTVLRRQLITLEESHLFGPSFLNSVRFGFSRVIADSPKTFGVIDPLTTDTSLGFIAGAAAGQIQVTGLEPFQGGPGGAGEFIYHYNSFQIYDDASLTRGSHSFGFGFSAERVQSNDLGSSHQLGQFRFGSVLDFLQNRPQNFISTTTPFETPRGFRQSIFGAYFQDDWRWRPHFTINLGVRYELATVPTEVQNKLATLTSATDPAPRIGAPYFQNPTLRNFEPRVGFSWDPFHDGKTAIRSGLGFYDVLPLHYLFELPLGLSYPFHQEGTRERLAPGTFPRGAFPLSRFRQAFIEQNPRRTYVMQWNLNVQRELAHKLTLFVGYIGSKGVHQPFNSPDMNIVLPTLTPNGYAWPAVRGSGTIVNPTVGALAALTWNGFSSYHGLQVKLTKPVARGLQVQGSYTWSKNIDTSSSSVAGSTFDNSITQLPFFDLRLTRGLSDFDIRHNATISYTWQLPSPPPSLGAAAWPIRGWAWGGIFQARSGVPFTPTIGGDPLGLNGSLTFAFPDRVPGCNPVNGNFKQAPGGPHYINTSCFSFPASNLPGNTTVPRLLGNSGRNSVIGPGLVDFDLSLMKNNPVMRISERFNLQFQAQFFNVLNHPNLAPPLGGRTNIFNQSGNVLSSAGAITSTLTTSRQLQFALKIIW
jgi:Carboxypeptidase regulatory-like domain/TonB dependent receptor